MLEHIKEIDIVDVEDIGRQSKIEGENENREKLLSAQRKPLAKLLVKVKPKANKGAHDKKQKEIERRSPWDTELTEEIKAKGIEQHTKEDAEFLQDSVKVVG